MKNARTRWGGTLITVTATNSEGTDQQQFTLTVAELGVSRKIIIGCSLPGAQWSITPEAAGSAGDQGQTVFDGLDAAGDHVLKPATAPTGDG